MKDVIDLTDDSPPPSRGARGEGRRDEISRRGERPAALDAPVVDVIELDGGSVRGGVGGSSGHGGETVDLLGLSDSDEVRVQLSLR